MGGSSEFIFCEPDTIIIDFELLPTDVLKCLNANYFGLYNNVNLENATKLTGKELKEYTTDCMKLYGYLGMNGYTQWEKFMKEILKQNSSVPNIKLHFFDSCGCVPYYFEIDREDNRVSISIGSELHMLCTDISYYDISQLLEVLKIKLKRLKLIYSQRMENSDEISFNCIPFKDKYYEYEFNKERYEKYYNLMKFKKEYFSDKIQEYMDKITPVNENDVRILLDLFPYALKINKK